MSSKPWWTVITSKELFQLRSRLLRFLEREFSGVVASDREDLVQDALVVLIRNKERVLPDDDGLYRYARRVAKNAALDLVKSAAHRMTTALKSSASGRAAPSSQRPVPLVPTDRGSNPKGPLGASRPGVRTFSEVADRFRLPSVEPSARAQLEKNEEILQIRKIFCELEDLNRLVLWSYVVDGQSINAIARQLGIGWHRVAYMIEHSLNRFRQHLS